MFKEILEQEIKDTNLQKIAQVVKGLGLFDMDRPLKKAGFKTTSMGYSALKVSKGSKSYMIASEKNAEAGPGDIIQDGMIIGVWN